MAAPWTELIIDFTLELELFYQCLPNKTLYLKGEECSSGKHSKVHLTGLTAGNAYGERLPMFVIRKSRCLKDVNVYLVATAFSAKPGCL